MMPKRSCPARRAHRQQAFETACGGAGVMDGAPGIAVAEIVLDQTQPWPLNRSTPRVLRADYGPTVRVIVPTWPFCRASRSLGLIDVAARLPPVHPHMLRHSCGFALANKGY